ncbi:hypothetical protein [Microbacterium sp. H1-D42]|uniref:hypothetical protein n=1 Tax=Microbacterium sp. H1-D42 TaxID=2925844 RepID=UPI001F52CF81|nr:hypothetical protein [Microbacterium sp. H1-D42]UNK70652.1 hypothetical protein MNR00_16065 [Microbacterium sp. H1-D42]
MSGLGLKVVVITIVIALLVVIVARAFRRVRPAPVKQAPLRQRMPLLFALVGAALLAIGFVMALASFTSQYTHELLPMRVTSVVLFVAGLCVLLAFRNWYIEAGSDAVGYRTVFGREKRIAYADIESCRTAKVFGRERVIVRSRAGAKLSVDAKRYDMSRVIAASR